MRLLAPLALMAASAFAQGLFAQSAAAAPATLAPVAFSSDFQDELEDDFGVREGVFLQQFVTDAVTEALARRGVELAATGGATIETAIIDAAPNRPTFEQLTDNISLDGFHSVSVGGAELAATIRGPDGAVLAEVTHRRYSRDIEDAARSASTWGDARLSIRQFANKVADAYVATVR